MVLWTLSWEASAPAFAEALAAPKEAAREQVLEHPTFEQLFQRHAGDVHRLVWRLLGPGASASDVEDLGQQAFLAVHRALPKFRGESKASTWLYGIVTRTVYKELRNRSRHRRMVATLEAKAVVLAERSPSPPAPEQRVELAEVWAVLMRIHPKKRVVFVLHEIEGLSGKEIARALEIKEPTVHTRLYHARRELMKALEAAR